VSHRPLVFVSGLTLCDYVLWSWSLNGNHTVLALISGLTLPPLAVVCVWLLAVSVARLIARAAGHRPGGRLRQKPAGGRHQGRRTLHETAATANPAPSPTASTDAPPHKLAA
jgi:hypothetical protein